jgi:hypothetical protein
MDDVVMSTPAMELMPTIATKIQHVATDARAKHGHIKIRRPLVPK